MTSDRCRKAREESDCLSTETHLESGQGSCPGIAIGVKLGVSAQVHSRVLAYEAEQIEGKVVGSTPDGQLTLLLRTSNRASTHGWIDPQLELLHHS